jgi:hypothetical protein
MIMRTRWFLVGSVFSLGILAGVLVAFGQTDSVVSSFQPFVVDVQQSVPVQVSIPISNTGAPILTVPLTVGISLRVNIEGPGQAVVEPLSTAPAEVAIATTTPMPTISPTPPIATVVATDGKTYKVTNLTAKYTAGGMWIGSTPTSYIESLLIVLTFVNDRVTATEEINIPFASMRRLMFKGASVPENLKAVFGKEEPIRIEMRDGSFKLLSTSLLVEISAEGTETKRITITSYDFKAGEAQGQAIARMDSVVV